MLSEKVPILASSKEELTPANVEPFKIDLLTNEPSFEKPMRYNQKLTKVIDLEIDSLL